MTAKFFFSLLIALFFVSCTRQPLKRRESAMRPTTPPAGVKDDLPLDDLLTGIDVEIALFRSPAMKGGSLLFGERKLSREDYALGLARFKELALGSSNSDDLFAKVRGEFDFHEVYGREHWGEVLITSYYAPEIPGSLTPTAKFSQPLYTVPRDLVGANLGTFDERFSDVTTFRGRLVKDRTPSGALQMVPYFTRKQIDGEGALRGQGLEICYVDPVDGFFLQIQGSGIIDLPNGHKLRLGYADQNGHKYEAVGKHLTSVITDMSAQAVEAHLKKVAPAERKDLLFKNPSYVFFREIDGEAVTSLGVPVIPGRTIATDIRYFPKGALAILDVDKPRFNSPSDEKPAGTEHVSRWVLDTDSGGAIRGGGRVDLFWGNGPEAKRYAGQIKSPGRLVYLVPKEETLMRLRAK